MKKLKILKPYFFIFLLFILIVTPYGVGRGIFFDGLTYSSISRNLAEGVGTFWKPHYTKTVFNEFYENLPLQFFLQSLFFRLFGDRIWVERVYGILIMLFSILFFILTLKELEILISFPEPEKRDFRLSWAGFLFIALPVIMYSALNNLLENTMTFFVILSCYFAIKSFNAKTYFIFSILSGISIFLAFLSKSVPGIFPLIIYPLTGIVLKTKGWFKRILYQFGSFIIILGFILIFIEDGRYCIFTHLKEQVFASVTGTRGVSKSRFNIIIPFIQETISPFIIALIFSRFKNWKLREISLFLLIIGLCGFLPLMVSQKVARRYLIPCLPFFAGFIAYSSYDGVYESFKNKIFKFLYKISILLIIFSIIILSITSFGKVRKNKKQWNEVLSCWEKLQRYKQRIVVKPVNFEPNWEDHAFYQRYFKWSFGEGEYLLERVDIPSGVLSDKYQILVDGGKIRLWMKK